MLRVLWLTIAAFSLSLTASGQQFPGGFGGQGPAGGQGGAGGAGGFGGQGFFPGGITISPEGVIASDKAQWVSPALEQKRLRAIAGQELPSSLVTPSKLRKVSLNRLEAACQQALDDGKALPEACRFMAGLTQVHYLFAAPETGDVILAGPAEGFAPLKDGRVVGIESGRPVLKLEDFLAMFRLKSIRDQLGCSFDPEPERLAKSNAWNKANNSPATAVVARQRFFQMANIMGNWNVTVFGLPPSSHAAIVTVEADYQLKRLGLGLERPRIRGFRSHLDMAGRNENTFERWWFAPHYNPIERTADGTAFRLSGPRLQLMSQSELVDEFGNRSDAPFEQVSSERYTQQFNKHIDALCQQIPSFASVQNIFDLAVVVALMRTEKLPDQVQWSPALFADESALPLPKYSVPDEVPSMVNVKSLTPRLLVGLIGGGVSIVPERLVQRMDQLAPADTPNAARPDHTKSWWWD